MKDEQPPASMTPQDALVSVMVSVSVADSSMTTPEIVSIQRIVDHLPVFAEYDIARIATISQTVFDLLEEDDGLDALFGLVRDALPPELYETAYAMACDVGASDGQLEQAELRILEEIRYELSIDRLAAAAIERGARARHMTLMSF